MSAEPIKVEVPVPDPVDPPEPTAPVVVVTESGTDNGAVEAVVVASQIENAGELAELKLQLEAQALELEELRGRTAVAEVVATESATAASEAAAAAVAAAEPEQAPAEDDEPPNNEHPWFRSLRK
jgi:hypothetical protein